MSSYKTIFIISFISFVLTVIFGFAAYQPIFEYTIRKHVTLEENSFVRQFYLKVPFPLDFKVYFFNVTNPDDVSSGKPPILQEIGPYCYDLYKERVNVVDNETEDSLTYSPLDTYLFNQNKSGELKDDDYVTILHPLIIGMVNYISANLPNYMLILDEALPHLFENQSIYLTAKVKDILFDGIFINCTTKDFSTMAVCSQLKTQIPGIIKEGKFNLRFGLLTAKNTTAPTRVKVLRGINNSKDLGKLISVDDVTKGNIFSTDECNEFKGTDGWIFPPLTNDLNQIWMHPTDFCMNFHADFKEETTIHGIKVRKFYCDFDNECLNCTRPDCAPKGFIDLTECTKVPMFLSFPHAGENENKLSGISYDHEKHTTQMYFESTLSLPIEGQIRAQFNYPLKSEEGIKFMQTIPQVVHPIVWAEMGLVLDGWFLSMVKGFFLFLTIMEAIKYLCLILSLFGMALAIYLYRNNQKFYSMKDTIALDSK